MLFGNSSGLCKAGLVPRSRMIGRVKVKMMVRDAQNCRRRFCIRVLRRKPPIVPDDPPRSAANWHTEQYHGTGLSIIDRKSVV